MKLIGSILVVVATTLIGEYYANGYKMRIKYLMEMHRLLQMLYSEVEFSRGVLEEALLQMERGVGNGYKQFLRELSKGLSVGNGKSLEEHWKEAVYEYLHIPYLEKEDYEFFLSIGEALGYLDYEMERRTIAMYIERLQKKIDMLEKEVSNKCKLYHTLGVTIGCMVVLVLI